MKIIGIAGTNGAGKDTIADVLKVHGFFVVSATEMLAEGLAKKGWPIDREHKSKLSTEWRRLYGMGAVVDRALELYESEKGKYKGFAVGSLRHPGEADRIHEANGQVVWVDADPKVRYERVKNANRGANKAAEDNISFDEFLAQQQREMQHSGDAATLSMADVKAKADVFLENNGNDVEAFKKEAEEVLGLNN